MAKDEVQFDEKQWARDGLDHLWTQEVERLERTYNNLRSPAQDWKRLENLGKLDTHLQNLGKIVNRMKLNEQGA